MWAGSLFPSVQGCDQVLSNGDYHHIQMSKRYDVQVSSPRISTLNACVCCLGPVETQEQISYTRQEGMYGRTSTFSFGICKACKKHRTELVLKRLLFIASSIVLSVIMTNKITNHFSTDTILANLIVIGSTLFNLFILSKAIRLCNLSPAHATRGKPVKLANSSALDHSFRFYNSYYAKRFAEVNLTVPRESKQGEPYLGTNILRGGAQFWIIPVVLLCVFLFTPNRAAYPSYAWPYEDERVEEVVEAEAVVEEPETLEEWEEYIYEASPPVEEVYVPPPVDLPRNGIYQVYTTKERIAPFKFITPAGLNFYIKIVDYYSGYTAMTVFVRSNSSVEVKVPIGSYQLKYACGDQWYGEDYLFGDYTSYNQALDVFNFIETDYSITSWEVTLYNVVGGNMETTPIDESDF